MSTTVVDDLLEARAMTHGRFEDNARVGQDLRSTFRSQEGWQQLTVVQREALDMIACKVSRILSGQGSHQDHWDDIAGYAKLVSDRCAKLAAPLEKSEPRGLRQADSIVRFACPDHDDLWCNEPEPESLPTKSGIRVDWATPESHPAPQK